MLVLESILLVLVVKIVFATHSPRERPSVDVAEVSIAAVHAALEGMGTWSFAIGHAPDLIAISSFGIVQEGHQSRA